jgi:hypothetical protein
MKKFSLVEFSVAHPKLVVFLTVIVTVVFLAQFPRMKVDTNPKHMLPETSGVRMWNEAVDTKFALYEDTIVVGIVNGKGVLNKETLSKIQRITEEVLKIEGVASRDVGGFSTITNVTAREGTLRVAPLMARVPQNEAEMDSLRKALFGNPLFVDRIISKDGRTTALYIPLEKGANGKKIADAVRAIVKREGGPEQYHIAGDPVARDTFGSEMFKLMALFAPLAGLLMFLVRYLMFRDLFLSATLMMDAMVSIVWSMGLLVALGFPVHIMSSMAPIFLMAIATDSIHIFNEFYFRYRERRDKKAAILDTMRAVGRPVRYTALATAAGFAVLLFMHITPVKVFGGLVVFGTVVLRLLSFSFIPAMFMFVRKETMAAASRSEDADLGATSRFLKGLAAFGVRRPKATVAAAGLLLLASLAGISRITVNNNMVEWFKKGSEIRAADRAMNRALGGTSLGYVVVSAPEDDEIKSPRSLRYIEGLQRRLEAVPGVGKTVSVADVVKRINRVLHDDDPAYDVIPETPEAVGQYLFLFGMSAKPSDLDNLVDYPFRTANIFVQLKTWDAGAMREVIRALHEYKERNPTSMELKPAGMATFNLVWNDEVLGDMSRGFIIAMIVVVLILALDFRSLKWAAVGILPLLLTVALIYGAIGFIGKDFDMPIAVLSCLSLGMAVDFAIHFIARFRQRLSAGEPGDRDPAYGPPTTQALLWTAARPGKGIMRNAVLFACAFSVMLAAPLTPYITVGAFIVAMMMISALLTIVLLPALITLLGPWITKGETP